MSLLIETKETLDWLKERINKLEKEIDKNREVLSLVHISEKIKKKKEENLDKIKNMGGFSYFQRSDVELKDKNFEEFLFETAKKIRLKNIKVVWEDGYKPVLEGGFSEFSLRIDEFGLWIEILPRLYLIINEKTAEIEVI